MKPLRRAVWAVAPLAALALASPARAQTRRAVLVGINTYVTGTAPHAASGRSRDAFSDLHGAVNDVEAVRAVLVARFGFKRDDVHVVENGAATRNHILNEIQKWLIDDASPGDVGFFYYAGHGSQDRNSQSLEPDKLDESIVPADSEAGVADIRDKEIARLFGRALDKHVLLTLGFDSCHSGSISRGLLRPVNVRGIAPDLRDASDPSNPPSLESRGAVVLTAAQSHQAAEEFVDEDGTAHGLFTWALVRTLRTVPANESVEQMYLTVRALMHSVDPTQDPDLSAPTSRTRAPIFGALVDAAAESRVAVRSVNSDGTFTIEGGLAMGLRSGCELRISGERSATAPMLRVTEADGLALSRATLVAGDASRIGPGTLLEITKWASPDVPLLRVWIGPALDTNAVLREGSQLDAVQGVSSVEWVQDPTMDRRDGAQTAVAQWDGSDWGIRAGAQNLAEHAGDDPRHWLSVVPADASGKRHLFVDLPVAADIKDHLKLGAGEANDAIAVLPDKAGADYVLVGRRALGGGVEYAWVRPLVGDIVNASTLALRSDWIPLDPAKPEAAAERLRHDALQLALIKNWLEMESPPGAPRIPYHLALRGVKSGEIRTTGPVHDKESYALVLTLDRAAAASHLSPQYVYVFIVNSSGGRRLLYPTDVDGTGENLFPQRDKTGQFPGEIRLGRGRIDIESPFGTDTYILLTTSTPLADPHVVEGDAVKTRGAAPDDPLSRLLRQAGSGMRGAGIKTPADWSIERLVIESISAVDREAGGVRH